MIELKNALRIHIAGWVLVFLLFLWIFYDEGQTNTLFLAIPMTICALPIFYSHDYILIHYWNRKRFTWYLLGLFAIFLLWSVLLDGIYKIFPGIPERFPIIIFSVILSAIANGLKNQFINAIERERRDKQAVQTELNYLKSQINPHFLFNTLNNIHALAYKKSAATADAILRLSSLMRYMLYESGGETVSLETEVNYLKDYIDLQQFRYGKESIVDLQIIGETANFKLAPLIFIHLLENAYKHSPAKLNSGEIKVGIVIKENTLSFSIENPVGSKKASKMDDTGGIGLSNIKRRLELLYKQHTFEFSAADNVFTVFLEITRF